MGLQFSYQFAIFISVCNSHVTTPTLLTYAHFLFFLSWMIYFFTAATSCCQMYKYPGKTAVTPALAFGCPGTCRFGRLSALVAFAMSAPHHLYTLSVCSWLSHQPSSFILPRVSHTDVKGVTFESEHLRD